MFVGQRVIQSSNLRVVFSFHTLLVFYDEDIAYGLVSMTLSEIEP